ncbi:MAG TPA: hypothetical protein VK674_00305 [Candidatus Limnocylindria bacterium]|nr:hypothetical protein [Candidatus Limnocylindria bacterium]
MFGRNDDQQQDQQQNDNAAPQADTGVPAFTPPDPMPSATLDASADQTMELPGSSNLPGNLTASAPSTDDSAAPAAATTAPAPGGPATADDLINIKQQALQHLSPLVDHLDQTPEERFRTTMMMIQATDDSSKIKDAYEAAQKIKDEKAQAQALLDIVNEINYFTQQQSKQQQ